MSYSFDADLIIGRGLNRHSGIFYYEDPLVHFDELYQIKGLGRGGEILKRNQVKPALKFLGDSAKCSFHSKSAMLLQGNQTQKYIYILQ